MSVDILSPIRQSIVQLLWEKYCQQTPQMQHLLDKLYQNKIAPIVLDHFAIIDLPGPHSGIPALARLFSSIGYLERGKDYLASKQNDFLWMATSDCPTQPAREALPQVVVADFRLETLPTEIKYIVQKYTAQTIPPPIENISQALANLPTKDAIIITSQLIANYLSGRDWPLPTVQEFKTVQAFNELLAWVLIFGRRPNHFTLSIHLLNAFSNFDDFIEFIEKEAGFTLNTEGNKIKGHPSKGLLQASTKDSLETIQLQDGTIALPTGFIEFIWRFPCGTAAPRKWGDYFTGFVAANANHVIESLYLSTKKDNLCEFHGG